MGITIRSKNKSIDMGCGGFLRLRRTVSELCPEEISKHYAELINNYIHFQYDTEACKKYDEKTEELYQKYRKKGLGKVFDFLYAQDTDARMTYGTAKQLLKAIGDYDNDQIYGYAGWGDQAARFKDFKEILRDATETKTAWGWD